MNLSITPVQFNKPYTTSCNCKRKSQQSFQALPVEIRRLPGEKELPLNVLSKRDKAVDAFTGVVEAVASRLGINTQKLEKEGYSVEFMPKFKFSSKMKASLKNKQQEVVLTTTQKPIVVDMSRDDASHPAKQFVHLLSDANLI